MGNLRSSFGWSPGGEVSPIFSLWYDLNEDLNSQFPNLGVATLLLRHWAGMIVLKTSFIDKTFWIYVFSFEFYRCIAVKIIS